MLAERKARLQRMQVACNTSNQTCGNSASTMLMALQDNRHAWVTGARSDSAVVTAAHLVSCRKESTMALCAKARNALSMFSVPDQEQLLV